MRTVGGFEWVTSTEAAEKLRMTSWGFTIYAKRTKMVCAQPRLGRGSPRYYLLSEVQFQMTVRSAIRGYRRAHRSTPENPSVEAMTAEECRASGFLTASEAEKVLGVSRGHVARLVKFGQLVGYQNLPGRMGSKLFVSRSAIYARLNDLEHKKARERFEKGSWDRYAGRGKEVVVRSLHRSRLLAPGAMTTTEASTFLGITRTNLTGLRRRGRLNGFHLRYGKREGCTRLGKFWFYWEHEVKELWESEAYQVRRQRYDKTHQDRQQRSIVTAKQTPGLQWEGSDLPEW